MKKSILILFLLSTSLIGQVNVVPGKNGGTGIANTGKTITLGSSINWPADASGFLKNNGSGTLIWSASNFWSLTGNSGITGSNFIGTTNNFSLRFRVNNVQKMIVDSFGNVGIGVVAPNAKLHVVNTSTVLTANIFEVDSGAVPFFSVRNDYRLMAGDNRGNLFIGNPNDVSAFSTFTHLTSVGVAAMGKFVTTASHSAAFGIGAGLNVTTASNCAFLGIDAGEYTTTGNNNTFVGYGAAQFNVDGIQSVVIGSGAGNSDQHVTNSVIIGYNAATSKTTNDPITAVGEGSQLNDLTGTDNTTLGSGTLQAATAANDNTVVGYNAMALVQGSPNGNTVMGSLAGLGDNSTTYNFCTLIGGQAGKTLGNSARDNIIIGYQSNLNVWNNLSGKLWIDVGNNAIPTIYGDLYSQNIGLGTVTPDTKLHIVGSIKMVDGNQGSGKVFTSDANGVGSWQSLSSDLIATSPLSISTNTISIPAAATAQNGYLTSTDWNTFNNKQAALTNPITGTGTSGQVAYWNGSSTQTSNNKFLFNGTALTVGGTSLIKSGSIIESQGGWVNIVNSLGGTFLTWTDAGTSAYRCAMNLDASNSDFAMYRVTGSSGSESFTESFRILNTNGNASFGSNSNTTYKLNITGGDIGIATAGNKLRYKTGVSNCSAGTGTLSGGTLVVSTTAVTANSLIFITDVGGTITNLGSLYVSARTGGTSFTVSSTNVLDASNFNWFIVEPY